MTVGILEEVKTDEFRVGATSFNVALLIDDGQSVLVQIAVPEKGVASAIYRDHMYLFKPFGWGVGSGYYR